jgi:hypothetical protein
MLRRRVCLVAICGAFALLMATTVVVLPLCALVVLVFASILGCLREWVDLRGHQTMPETQSPDIPRQRDLERPSAVSYGRCSHETRTWCWPKDNGRHEA